MKRLIAGALIVWSACASAQACLPGEPNPNWKPVIASMFSSSDYVLLARVADWTNNTKLTECGTNAGAIAPESMTEPRTRPSCNSLNVAFDTIEVFKGPDVKRLRLSSFGSRFVAADEAKLLPSGVVAAPLVAKDYNDWGLKTRYLVISSSAAPVPTTTFTRLRVHTWCLEVKRVSSRCTPSLAMIRWCLNCAV